MSASRLVLERLPARHGELWVGHEAARALLAAGYQLPGLMKFVAHGEGLLARLSARQFLLLGVAPVAAPPAVVRLGHACVEFTLAGADVRALLAEVASASLAECAPDTWFCTRICGLDAVLCQAGQAWRVVCAPAEAPWLGVALAERVRARGGEAPGSHH